MRRDLIETSSRFALTAFLQLACFFITSKLLSVEVFGQLSLILAYSFIIANISVIGLPAAQVYFLVDKEYKKEIIELTFIHTLALFSFSTLLAFLFYFFDYETLFYISLISSVQSVFLIVSGVFQSLNMIRKLNLISLLQWACLCIVLFLINTPNLFNMVAAYFISYLITICYSLLLLKSRLDVFFSQSFMTIKIDRKKARTIYKYGFISFSSSLVGFLNHRLGLLIVGLFLGNQAAGLYSFAIQIVERLAIFSQAFATVYFPKVRRMSCLTMQKEQIKKAIQYLLLLLLPVSFLFILFYQPIIEIVFGTKYQGSYTVINILIVGVLVTSVARLLFILISANGHVVANLKISSSCLILNALVSLVCVFYFGRLGVAITTSLIAFLSLYLAYSFLRKA